MYRLDYAELVVALQEGDEPTANELLKEVIPRLVEYLQVVMGAGKSDAEDCAHQVFLETLEKIREGKIKENRHIYFYLIKSSRNRYLRIHTYNNQFDPVSDEIFMEVQPAEQIKALVDEERMRMLEECLSEIGKENQKIIRYFMDHPDKSAKEAGKDLNISEVNARVKRSRLIQKLHACVEKKRNR